MGLSLGLTCASIVLLFFPPFCQQKIREDDRPTGLGLNVSFSKVSVLVAADILQSIDQRVDPCEDFYAYACHGWKQQHPIPEVGTYFFNLSGSADGVRQISSKQTN